MGQIYESESNYLLAIQTYKKLISMNGEFLEAYLNLASLYNISGNLSASINIRKEGLKILNASV